MTSNLDELTKAVVAKSHVRLDTDKVADLMSSRVTKHFDQAVDVPVKGLREDLDKLRTQMSELGSEKLTEIKGEVDDSIKHLEEAEQRIKSVERRVTFVGVSRLALATLPLFVSLLIVGSLVWGLGTIVGVGPLFGWAWSAFCAASGWYKALVGLGTFVAAAVFVCLVLCCAVFIKAFLSD